MHQVSKLLFCHETLHVSGIYCTHHQELSTVRLELRSNLTLLGSGHITCMKHLPRVQLITPDDGHSRCPKRVEFRDKIKKFGFLMHLVGYLYEGYHDARSLEYKVRQILLFTSVSPRLRRLLSILADLLSLSYLQ